MDLLRPGYERVKDIEGEQAQRDALERQAVLISLENLMTFPFLRDRVESGDLSVHGLWHDIGNGTLEQYLPSEDSFAAI